jgi:hypothetical protein
LRKLIIIIVLFISIGCNKLDNQDEFIRFSVSQKDQVITRGTPISTSTEMVDMGVFAYYTGDGIENTWSNVGSSSFPNFMNNDKLVNSLGSWNSQKNVSWPSSEDANVTFFSYSPYASEANGLSIIVNNGFPKIHYEVPQICIDQPDLLVSVPVLDKNIISNGSVPVPFSMNHALSCIGFKIKGNGEKIDKIAIKGISISGDLCVDNTGAVIWSNLGEPINAEFQAGIPTSLIANEQVLDANRADGYLMMIPQKLGENAKLVVTVEGVDKEICLTGEWIIGEKYIYSISIKDIISAERLPNSYIVNPSVVAATELYIPIRKINYFWGTYLSTPVPANTIPLETDEWAVDSKYTVVKRWSDFGSDGKENPSITFEKVNKNISGTPSEHSVKITIPANCPEGNLIFDVKIGTTIVWSWHIWVTDYNPDAIASLNSATSGVYIYNNLNYSGQVHRYVNGASINTGITNQWTTILAEKFIMDRNLGSRNPTVQIPASATNTGPGVLYFQFGRKDPFPGSYSSITAPTSTTIPKVTGPKPTSYSIINPNYYITGNYNWVSDDTNPDYVWLDKNTNITTNNRKSIFDPCPYGWRIPIMGLWSCFSTTTTTWYSNNRIFKISGTSITKYPAAFQRERNSADIVFTNIYGYYWTSSASSTSNASYYFFSSSSITANVGYRTRGALVRCVQE